VSKSEIWKGLFSTGVAMIISSASFNLSDLSYPDIKKNGNWVDEKNLQAQSERPARQPQQYT